jgi:hypothetical protein
MKRVYVAGAYSANNVITIFDNMREGMRASLEVFRAGFAPFCPWLDFHYNLMLRGDEKLTVPDFYEYSIAWLDVSDAMYVHPNSDWRNSVGTLAEIKRAKQMAIPVYYDLDKLIECEGV